MARYRPDCAKMECRRVSDVVYYLPTFGPVWFCAKHGLMHLKEYTEGLLQ